PIAPDVVIEDGRRPGPCGRKEALANLLLLLGHRLRNGRCTREVRDRLGAEGLATACLVRFDYSTWGNHDARSECGGQQEREHHSTIQVPRERELAKRCPHLLERLGRVGDGWLVAHAGSNGPGGAVEHLSRFVVAGFRDNTAVRT